MIDLVLFIIVIAVGASAFYYLIHNSPTKYVEQISVSEEPVQRSPRKKSPQRKKSPTKEKYDDDAVAKVVQPVKTENIEDLKSFAMNEDTWRNPASLAAKNKKEVVKPTKKQIEQDLEKGFVVISKKGQAPLTSEQKRERAKARTEMEEENARREKEMFERAKKKKEQGVEKPTFIVNEEESQAKIQKVLEEQRKQKQNQMEMKKKAGGGAIKFQHIAPKPDRKIWDSSSLPVENSSKSRSGEESMETAPIDADLDFVRETDDSQNIQANEPSLPNEEVEQ